MLDLLDEVGRFQRWAQTCPPESRSGEWECDYEHWGDLHAAVLEFLDSGPLESWSREAVQAVLYAIARDNELEYLAGEIAEAYRPLLVPLTRVALEIGEPDARWQFAVQLGRVGEQGGVEEEVLLLLVQDECEYVRRRAIGSLARIGSAHAEGTVLQEWDRAGPHQEWARMMCLWSLHRLGSPLLPRFLAEAEQDPRVPLQSYAQRVRRDQLIYSRKTPPTTVLQLSIAPDWAAAWSSSGHRTHVSHQGSDTKAGERAPHVSRGERNELDWLDSELIVC